MTREDVQQILQNLRQLLEKGAAGRLGDENRFLAAKVFRLLVGGKILVRVERRANRKRTIARGSFRPSLLNAAEEFAEARIADADRAASEEVTVWLREPPKMDRLAERVHQLVDIDGLTFAEAADVLRAEESVVGDGLVWQVYRRYYEMIGQPVPKKPYNNGRPRKPREETAA